MKVFIPLVCIIWCCGIIQAESLDCQVIGVHDDDTIRVMYRDDTFDPSAAKLEEQFKVFVEHYQHITENIQYFNSI